MTESVDGRSRCELTGAATGIGSACLAVGGIIGSGPVWGGVKLTGVDILFGGVKSISVLETGPSSAVGVIADGIGRARIEGLGRLAGGAVFLAWPVADWEDLLSR